MELDIYIAIVATIGAAASVFACIWTWNRHRSRVKVVILPTVSEGVYDDGRNYRYDTMIIRVLNDGDQSIRVDRVLLMTSDNETVNTSNKLKLPALVPSRGSYDFVF